MHAIRSLKALEILDSRGNPTLAVTVELSSGIRATAHVPSGASAGRHEALELRDNDPQRYGGKGVMRAARNVEEVIAPQLAGFDAEDQGGVDGALIALDGTADKSRLGANAILGVSCAVARAAAETRGIPLWRSLDMGAEPCLPMPMVNILSGGLHAGRNIEFQDFLVIPHGFESFDQALEAVVAVHRATRATLEQRGFHLTGVADEGGWGPALASNEHALEVLTAAIERAGFRPADQISIGIDAAASHFYRNGRYELASEARSLAAQDMIDMLAGWTARFPVISIEDALEQDDWDGWAELTRTLGSRIQLIGDDLFVTSPARLARGIRERAANTVLVKMNQVGTLTETAAVLRLAREGGFRAVVSARSGETEDSFLADLAVASGAGQIKIGSVTRSERLAKYNRLLEIEASSKLGFARRGLC